MSAADLSLEELTKFGIQTIDEGIHPHDPSVEWWNESWFWDWFDRSGDVAGHCRIGLHPVQRRAWVWFFLYRRGDWIALEQPRLPIAALRLPDIAYDDGWGLRFSYEVHEPLRAGRFKLDGFGRVISGRRTGQILPLGADLEVRATGAAHTIGRSTAAGHSSESYDACRFEQPITLAGALRFGEARLDFEGRGERDHSWGPRLWNMEWTFLAVSNDRTRLQCAEARLPNAGRFAMGYLKRETTISLWEVGFDLELNDESVREPLSGSFTAKAEDGTVVGGAIEVLSAAEIDITHTFVPPERSIYRRALIRVNPDRGGEPLLGWMELNYFPKRS